MVETTLVGSDTASHEEPLDSHRIGVSAHQSSPDRVVLVEAENADGWIAFDADAAVALDR